MKKSRLILLIVVVLTAVIYSCSDDNSPGGKSSNTGGNNNSGACAGGPTTVSDIDGNVYNVVSIGNQCWMKENLKTTRFRNATLITTGLNQTQWCNTFSSACSDFLNDTANTRVYGKLYNYYAVADINGLCPYGWHVPTVAEWDSMSNYLGGYSIAGGKMKEIGLTHWASPNTGATNNSGFTGLPGGGRSSIYQIGVNNDYTGRDSFGYWWTSTLISGSLPKLISLDYDNNKLNGFYNADNQQGASVRCVRD